MDDKRIILPPFLIAELYRGTLVDLETRKEHLVGPALQPEALVPEKNKILEGEMKFLGENKARVVILVNEPEAAFLVEEDLAFLTNILKACNLNLTDIAIINFARQTIDYPAIKDQLKAQTIILFDVDPSAIKLPFLIPAFQLQKFDGCTIMVAPALALLNKTGSEGKLLKTKLWLSLKHVFNIS